MIPTEVPVTNPVVVLREEFDDWAVLFNPDTAEAIGINPVGVEIWKQMDGRQDIDRLITAVSEHFAEVPGSVGQEVTVFVHYLIRRGFVGFEIRAAV